MGGVLGWDSFSQPWFVHDDEVGPISLMVHSSKSGQPMYGSNLGSKVGLLELVSGLIWVNINEYGFGSYEIQSYPGLIKILRSFSCKDQQNILLKLKGKFFHYCPYYLGEYLATKEEAS
jgi:hypothetical protein